MKKETKALIEWIKAQIGVAAKLDDSYLITTNAISTHKNLEKDAVKFLDSLAEIESHLCRGGYIQDRNGTPCCDGDKVRFEFEDKTYEENWKDKYSRTMIGVLQFSVETKSFCIIFGPENYGYDWIDWTTSDYGCKWFEKVDK